VAAAAAGRALMKVNGGWVGVRSAPAPTSVVLSPGCDIETTFVVSRRSAPTPAQPLLTFASPRYQRWRTCGAMRSA